MCIAWSGITGSTGLQPGGNILLEKNGGISICYGETVIGGDVISNSTANVCISASEGAQLTVKGSVKPVSGAGVVVGYLCAVTIEGNIKYWKCSRYKLYFKDRKDTTPIAYADTKISETGHLHTVLKNVKKATYQATG